MTRKISYTNMNCKSTATEKAIRGYYLSHSNRFRSTCFILNFRQRYK